MKLVWRPRALEQLDAICSYIANDNPSAAASVREAIEPTAMLVATFPPPAPIDHEPPYGAVEKGEPVSVPDHLCGAP